MSQVIDGLFLVDEATGATIGEVNKAGLAVQTVFNSLTEFTNAGGAAVRGIGKVWIAGQLYWCDGVGIKSLAALKSKRLKIAVIGNSIAGQLQNTAGSGSGTGPKLAMGHPLTTIDSLLGVVFEPVECTATTRCDSNGVYGYSGGRLGGGVQSIIDDLPTQFFDALDSAGQIPDVVWCYAIVENDIATDAVDYATLKSRVDRLVLTLRQKWPGVLIILSGCRPSASIDTTAKKQVYSQINAYIKSLDNSVDVYSDIPTYLSSSSDVTQPASISIVGSVSGSTLTVESTPEPIKLGYSYGGLAVYITAFVSGTGGTGTYTLASSPGNLPSGSTIKVYKYTADGIHPSPRGRLVNARGEANIFKRVASKFVSKYRVESHNPILLGSTAVNVIAGLSGTMPTNALFVAQTAGVTTVSEALNPGWRVTYSTIPDSASVQVLTGLQMPEINPLPNKVFSFKPYIRMRIVSGAEYIHMLGPQYRTAINGGAATPSVEWYMSSSNDGGADYINGDEFYFSAPIIRATTSDYYSRIFQYLNAIRVVPHVPASATIVIEIIDAGFEVVDNTKGTAVLVAGTATVAVPEGIGITSESKISVSTKTPLGTPGALFVSAKTAGTSFVISSTNAGDTSVVSWEIIN